MKKRPEGRLPALMRAHPWGTLVCFNPLFVFNVSLHTPLIQWNPCEAYQLMLIIKHKRAFVKTFLQKNIPGTLARATHLLIPCSFLKWQTPQVQPARGKRTPQWLSLQLCRSLRGQIRKVRSLTDRKRLQAGRIRR